MSALARTSTFSKLSFFISFQEIIQENRIPHQYHSHFAGWTFNFSCIWGVRSQIRKENKFVKGKHNDSTDLEQRESGLPPPPFLMTENIPSFDK